MKRVACIYNEGSGTIADQNKISKAFTDLDIAVDFLAIKLGEQELLKKLKESTYDCVIAAGGDGTVRLTAQLATECDLTLGVLPLGTLNHFAKDLGLPLVMEQAAQLIATGLTTKVDYCSVNDHVFVNNASLGIYPATVKKRDKAPSFLGKWLAGAKALINALHDNRNVYCTIVTPEGEWNFSSPLIFIGNNPYVIDKIGLGNRPKLTTGDMFLYVVRTKKRRKLLLLGMLSLVGIRLSNIQASKQTAGPLTIQSGATCTNIALDGEVFTMDFPLKFTMHAGQLSVLKQ